MSTSFLEIFLYAARSITQAERGMAVDKDMQVLGTVNLDRTVMESPTFSDFANTCLRQAMQEGSAVITNNTITNPSEAPTTNTNFADLRVVVALPVVDYGAIYLDQHIRDGIVDRATVEKLMRLADHVREQGGEDHTEDQLVELYKQLE